ncbi:MAG TPA: FAD-binding oxidoreductase [Arenicellales bacterium]|jgi:glycine/D-amino acid oxidase-like deaminating enzyme|uniref:FAD dependent oxidoreductase domain-containing protein n=1 Tax=marine metagenome TaxID=408172 RepID=A0A381XH83_9ZZZZ|nr:FAD-binding oxidoreductase [Arenicellales bacterium]MEC7791595.1 FAD-binding oxidoreductase [Pseudomonadota bacterium]MEC8870548.1 FAD-binding oxidoreductase [Pseudomonadota bacterium]MEE3280611.1 FAD-binding oxidoreductase [Pseudomonadota bacterium]MEE3293875.1 FAD-binding oxidoreductase [Pseudomonadota bacterium]
MPPLVDPVPSDQQLPKSTEVAIIGGGIIGVSAALTLAERGIPVALFEKGHIAGEQSSRNWGWCRQQGRDPRELPLIIESLALWRKIHQRTRCDVGFRQCGILYLANTAKDVADREAWLQHGLAYGVESRMVSSKEINKLLPGSNEQWAGGLYTPTDGRAEPTIAAPAIARAARQLGARIFTQTAVRGIEKTGGRISAVVTENGSVQCSTVILAGGAWSSTFCRNLDLRLPLLMTIGSVFRTAPLNDAPERSVSGAGFAIRKRLDGGYTVSHGSISSFDIVPDSFRFLKDFLPLAWMARKILRPTWTNRFKTEWRQKNKWSLDEQSPFEHIRTLDPMPIQSTLNKSKQNLIHAFPAFQDIEVVESWGGLIDATPDAVPVISPVDNLPGFFLATGLSGHGFGIGPAAGQLAADVATASEPLVDPTPFRFSRFSDGSRIQPIVGI